MNWEVVGAVSEAIAAIGVIISLLYLAKQISQNSKVVSGTSYQQFRALANEIIATRIADPELNDIWERGLESYSELQQNEKSRFAGMVFMLVGIWESQFYLQQTGILEQGMGANIAYLTTRPGFAEWWEERKWQYNDDFQAWIEKTQSIGA